MKAVCLAISLTLFWIPVLKAQDALETARRLENTIKSMRTLRADFEQLYFPASVSEPIQEKGELYLQKPDFMRWEYKTPEEKVFLAANGRFEMYLAAEKQVIRSVIPPEAYESDIIGILLGSRSVIEAYQIESVRFPTDAVHVKQIKLTPNEEGEFSHLLLEVDSRTWLLRRAVIIEWAGNKREYVFRKLRPNATLPGDIFKLRIPPGCEIIEDRGD